MPRRSGLAAWRNGRRSIAIGAAAAVALAAAYAAVVAGLSGSVEHLLDQTRDRWYLIVPIVAGFGAQVGLMAELRRRHRLAGSTKAAGIAGAGAGTAGMVACCAHHVADLAPVLGAGGAAAFLTAYQVPLMGIGLAATAGGILLAVRRLSAGSHRQSVEVHACVVE